MPLPCEDMLRSMLIRPATKSEYRQIQDYVSREASEAWDRKKRYNHDGSSSEVVDFHLRNAQRISDALREWQNQYEHIYSSLPN